MNFAIILFWVLVFFIIYPYFIYPVLLWIISIFKKQRKYSLPSENNLPTVTLFITAFNEQDYVDQKVNNSNALNYPNNRLKQVWVTDGSDDNTNSLLKKHDNITIHFKPERNGKIHAMNRGMDFIDSDLVVFSDGNTLLGENTIMEMVKLFSNAKVGCVAGEKRIFLKDKDGAASAGEGFYWKYESWVKNLDSKVGSTIGAAGELFAIRSHLFQKIENDTILDDFIISLRIAMQGYRVDYSPKAYAIENASANISEEMKRKVRIAAGSIQAVTRLKALLNPFKHGGLSIQYFSHKIFRWLVAPISLILLLILNITIIFQIGFNTDNLYTQIGILQALFYFMVLMGLLLKNKNIKLSWLFIPYYFFMANYAMWLGFFKFLRGKQSVNWERAKRAKS